MSASNDKTRTNNQVISTLNDLIRTCHDGEHGYRAAADGVNSVELKTLFDELSSRRLGFVDALQAEVFRLGGRPFESGSVEALSRGWFKFKAVVDGGQEAPILAECKRDEEWALKHYQQALDSGLPADVQLIVELQFAQVKKAHEQMQTLAVTGGFSDPKLRSPTDRPD